MSQPIYDVTSLGLNNPCTGQNLLTGTLYFPVARDATRFIQCSGQGQSVLLTCPANMVWDARVQACVYATQAGMVVATNVIGAAAGTSGIETSCDSLRLVILELFKISIFYLL